MFRIADDADAGPGVQQAGSRFRNPAADIVVEHVHALWRLAPDGGGKDIFVHISAVERAGLRSLAESQAVSFEVTTDRKSGKDSAEQLRAL